jgi:carboxypeptidase D
MKYISFVAVILTLLFPSVSLGDFDPDQIIEVRIDNINRNDLPRLTQMGADIDRVWKHSVRAFIRSDRLDEFKRMGYAVTVIPKPKTLRGNDGYHTHTTLTDELKAVEAAHPGLCRLYNIGSSVKGMELWFMKLSENVDIKNDKPKFVYIAAIHGNEPVGTELCIKLIHLLTDGYGTDPEITKLMKNIEIWIMPMMNPDGYMSSSRYNAQGKDLNRSFPDRVTDPVNTTGGRPIETQVIMNWYFTHSPALSASFHTGAQVVVYPYDSDPDSNALYSLTPDNELFRQLAMTYSSLNPSIFKSTEFSQGIINGLEWYPVYGGMQDWNYIWMGCNQITIELSDTFIPAYSMIPAIWENNRDAMLSYMKWSLKGIRGIVTDSSTGTPIRAAIRVEGIDHDVYADSEMGDYHRIILPGTYSIRFSADGYVSRSVSNVAVSSGDAIRLDISLSAVEPGDINGDGAVDLKDAIAALRVLSGIGVSFHLHTKADVSGDGKIGLEEVIYVLQTCTKNIREQNR